MLKNIGTTEIIVIAVFLLFLFGSKKLIGLARGLGEANLELKKVKEEFKEATEQKKEKKEEEGE